MPSPGQVNAKESQYPRFPRQAPEIAHHCAPAFTTGFTQSATVPAALQLDIP